MVLQEGFAKIKKESSHWLKVEQSELTSFYAPNIPLSNGENRRPLPGSYQQLFKKQPIIFYFEKDNSTMNLNHKDFSFRHKRNNQNHFFFFFVDDCLSS